MNCQHFAYDLMRDFPQVPQGLSKKEEKQRPVRYIIEMPVIMGYYIMLTVNPICIFVIYPRKMQTTYSPLLNKERDPLGIVLQDLLF